MELSRVFDWLAGYPHQYMTLYHCMDHDTLWVAITVGLDLAVAAGYALIALHWWRNQRSLSNSGVRQAMGRMRNIFLFCGLCGYLFIPIKMFWPAWRLYDLFLVALVYFTWRYAWGARNLKVVYHELNRSQQLAADLEASRAEAKRKSFFLNAISHDLRNPLYGLSLQADVVQMHMQRGNWDGAREAMAQVRRAAQETSELLNHFLELGRLDWSDDRNQVSEFDLRESLATAARSFSAAAAEKGLGLHVECAEGVKVCTDRAKFERIAANLVSNAVKFTERGDIWLKASKQDERVTLSVIDTGPGIAPEHQKRVFDEFYQVGNEERQRDKGFGLGLAICQRLARQLGGTLTLESQVGRGSRFTLDIPVGRCGELGQGTEWRMAG